LLAAATGYSVAALQKLASAGKRCRSLANAEGRSYFYAAFGFPEPKYWNDEDHERFNLLGRVLVANETANFLNELKLREPDVAAYAELAVAFQQASLIKDARVALRPLHIGSSEYHRLFSLIRSGSERASLEDMLALLAAQGPIDSCALFEFFFRIADSAACSDPEALRTWVSGKAEPRHYADLEEKRLRSRAYTVVVSIKPRSGRDEKPSALTVWLLENGRSTGRIWKDQVANSDDWAELSADLMHRLEDSISQAIACGDGPVFIEILVPMGLLRWQFNQLGIKHEKGRFKKFFGREHPVVIRWRDRQSPNFVWAGSWRKSSQHIRKRLAARPNPKWEHIPEVLDETFVNSLDAPTADFLYLGTPAPPSRGDDSDWLVDLMVAGVPFAGWLAGPVPDPANIPPLLDQLLRGDFDELPARVPEMRRSALCADLHSMILLWDDAEHRHTFLLEEPA
jgi:hypothetical protein